MATEKDATVVLRGELYWAKVLGNARPHTGNPKYDKGPFWSVDVTPDKASRKTMKELGILEKLREPNENDDRKESFLTLRVLENRSNGDKNSPPRVVDIKGKPWGDELLGNKTIADVKVRVKDYGAGVQKGVYLQAIRVLDHVPYEAQEFAPLDEDDEFFKGSDDKATPEDLDDEIPF